MFSAQKLATVAFAFFSAVNAGCLADLQAINTAVQNVNTKVNAVTATSCGQFTFVQQANQVLVQKLQTARSNANAAAISNADQETCYKYLCIDNVWPSTNTLIGNVISKLQVAKTCAIVSQAKTLLTTDKNEVSLLADAYIARGYNQDIKNRGAACKTKFLNRIQEAITAYS